MGRPRGIGNRLRWNPAEVLDTLASSVTRNEIVQEFKLLPVAEKVNLLLRLEAASGVVEPRGNGGDHAAGQ